MKTTTPLTIALLSLSVLTACGGGGGHENFTSPPPPGTPVSDSSTGTDNTRPARLLDRRPDEKRPTRANAGNAINTGAVRRNKDRVAAQYTPHKNNKLHRK